MLRTLVAGGKLHTCLNQYISVICMPNYLVNSTTQCLPRSAGVRAAAHPTCMLWTLDCCVRSSAAQAESTSRQQPNVNADAVTGTCASRSACSQRHQILAHQGQTQVCEGGAKAFQTPGLGRMDQNTLWPSKETLQKVR